MALIKLSLGFWLVRLRQKPNNAASIYFSSYDLILKEE